MSESDDAEIVAELRNMFEGIAKNGVITAVELGEAFKAAGETIPNYKLREIMEDLDKDKSGTVDFEEFLEMFSSLSTKVSFSNLKQLVKKRIEVKSTGGAYLSSAEGTKHSLSDAETAAFSDWINYSLLDDPDCKKLLPIKQDSNDLFEKIKDGILLCKMVNLSVPGTIDERCINKSKVNTFTITENQNLAINSARAIGCNLVNIGAADLMNGTAHLTLGLLWQTIRIGLLARINLSNCPNLACLLRDGETLEDLLKLSPEEILLRWVNYHLEKSGCNRRITNFGADISDSEAYSVLLKRISPPEAGVEHSSTTMSISNLTQRAEHVLKQAGKINCRKFLSPMTIVQPHQKLNLAFVANLFNNFPCLDEVEAAPVIEETREEKTFRNWMNSLGVKPFVNYLYSDLTDGLVLLQLYKSINPKLIDDCHINQPPFRLAGNMKKIENCNYAIELGSKFDFSLVGIGGEDIFNGNKTLTLALLWQMMRAYTIKILQNLANSNKPISDSEIVAWANEKLNMAGSTNSFTSFKDPSLATGLALLDLVNAIKPNSVDYNNVNSGCTPDEKLLNAKYAISLARRIGATVYALPEDLVEVNPKMIMTVFACLMARALNKAT